MTGAAGAYCIQATVGGFTFKKPGPAGDITTGVC